MEDPVVLPEKGGVMLQEASHYDNFSDLECHCARKFQDNAPHKKHFVALFQGQHRKTLHR